MEKRELLLMELGPASRAGDQFSRIIGLHPAEAPLLHRKRVMAKDFKGALREIQACLERLKPLALVLSCDEESSRLLPTLGAALGAQPVPLLAILKSRSSTFIDQLHQCGFTECFVPPLREVRVWPSILLLLAEAALSEAAKDDASGTMLEGFIGRSSVIAEALRFVSKIAGSSLPVLITGETGTGKEICARGIHRTSARRNKPFVATNCASLPEDLLVSELFGHKSGAYTGAKKDSPGIVAQARDGVLLLDEIDSLSLPSQGKLLRFLETQEVRALGETRVKKMDVRIMVATNADLVRRVEESLFRADLFFRLDVIHIHLPPLRQREGDILLLARHFLRNAAVIGCRPECQLSRQAERILLAHPWPGNVRELRNVLERAALFCPKGSVTLDARHIDLAPKAGTRKPESYKAQKRRHMKQFEKPKLLEFLEAHGGNITQAAQAAQMNRQVFSRKMITHGIVLRSSDPQAPTGSRSPG